MDREEYREVYLRSEHWAEMRLHALARAGRRCQVCNDAKRLDVHHRTYERVGQELLGDLTVLCRSCHELFHGPKDRQQPRAKSQGRRKKSKSKQQPKERKPKGPAKTTSKKIVALEQENARLAEKQARNREAWAAAVARREPRP